ncbi:MAG: alpha/beta fold hydrolase [Phycisphaerae bacterium]|nr:alpha/beta fold hydrolase [Phycisphaerae bacterium]
MRLDATVRRLAEGIPHARPGVRGDGLWGGPRRVVPSGLVAGLVVALAGGAGCASFLAGEIVQPPNAGKSVEAVSADDRVAVGLLDVERVERVEVGPPAAEIACWVLEPTDGAPPRGTVFVLHGFGDGPFWMLGKGRALAHAGYRAIVVALRGYAGSTGDVRTFTAIERCDCTQVLDELLARGVAVPPIGVWGMSYGASTAIAWAGEDPRIDAVVAVAGFSSMREITPHFVRTIAAPLTIGIDDAAFDALVLDAATRGGFELDAADVTGAMAKTDAAVLIMHGEWDLLVPPEHGERLAGAGNAKTEFVRLPARGHVGAWMDVDGRAKAEGLAWLERWMRQRK